MGSICRDDHYTEAREVRIQLIPHFEANVESEDTFLGMLIKTTKAVSEPEIYL
jgi:hypothetical protein